MDVYVPAAARVISRAVGVELRRAREAGGWSRGQLCARLPSGIGDRTLLSYEHGTRQVSMIRVLELCQTMKVSAPDLINRALIAARIDVQNLVLRVDLNALLRDKSDKFRPLFLWARNKLNTCPDGVTDVAPAGMEELAAFLGYSLSDLANYLAKFAADGGQYQEAVTKTG